MQTFSFSDKWGITIGRSKNNVLVLPEKKMGEEHCKIFYDETWKIKNLSTNCETKINGVNVAESILKHGDIIQIGKTLLEIEITERKNEVIKSREKSINYKKGFISGLEKVVTGAAVGIAAVTVLPLAAIGLGAAGVATAATVTVGTLVGAAAGVGRLFWGGSQKDVSTITETNFSDTQNESVKVQIFYATDRAKKGDNRPNHFYGDQRNKNNSSHPLDFGKIEISIPKWHEKCKIERPKWWKCEFKEDPNKHVTILSIHQLSDSNFFSELNTSIHGSSDKDAFVFIHGYNQTFAQAARRTAQIAFDLAFRGAPICYSWPSMGNVSGYEGDQDSVKFTTEHLLFFLKRLVKEAHANKIHLIAHSMGNRALTDALIEFTSSKSTSSTTPVFNQIILAAPDIDSNIFETQIAPKIKLSSKRITLYASSKDKALVASRKLRRNKIARAGEGGSSLIVTDGIDSIDASNIDTSDALGHGYWAATKPLIDDISKIIHNNSSPDSSERKLKAVFKNGFKYYMFDTA